MRDVGDPLGRLTKHAVRDLLGKGWLTHDGMWFVHASAEVGIEGANALNRAAIRGMAEIEVRRLVEALEVGLGVLLPGSVSSRISVSAPSTAILRAEWEDGECFAYKGMRRAGLLDGYRCGVLYRIECWLEALGIGHEADPAVGRCQMRVDGSCVTEFHLVFD